MSQAHLSRKGTEQITVFALDSNNGLVTGVTWALKIVRLDNGQYWNGSAWQSGVTTVSMTEASSANRPGEYVYAFTPPDFGYICSVLATTANSSVINKAVAGSLNVGYGVARDAEFSKKYIRNKIILDTTDGTYSVKEDDNTTEFEAGTFSSGGRGPS